VKSLLGNELKVNYQGKTIIMNTVVGKGYQIDPTKLTL
jgi:hypothetical protein